MLLITRNDLKSILPLLRMACWVVGLGLTAMVLGYALLYDAADVARDTIIYSVPMVFLFFVWVWARLEDDGAYHVELVLIDFVVLLLTGLRAIGYMYHSGHVLFLAYTFVTTKSKTYRVFALPMIAVTAYYKFVEWGDVVTPALGLILAYLLIWYRKRKSDRLQLLNRVNT